jgi:hypothetical protein
MLRPLRSPSVTFFQSSLSQSYTSWPGRLVVASSSSLDDGAQFLARRIPSWALSKRGPFYAFPDVRVANGSTSEEECSCLSLAVASSPLRIPGILSTASSSKLSLCPSLSLLHSQCRSQIQLKTFSSGPRVIPMTEQSKLNEEIRLTLATSRQCQTVDGLGTAVRASPG